MTFDSIVFDLDGTLWDTTNACVTAWNSVVARLGVEFRTIVSEDVRAVTGKPHDECIRVTFQGVPEEQVLALIEETATEDVAVIARDGGTLYDGVPEGLAVLAQTYRLFIVSNCQAGYIETFLSLSGLGHLFEDVECFGNTGQPKGENLRRLIERNWLLSPLMVGDAEGDETAARLCGVPFAFMSYGFGGCTAPDYRFDSFASLLSATLT